MGNEQNSHIARALRLADALADLANTGEAGSIDDGCAVLYGIIRDCAYTIRERASRERRMHQLLGIWDDGFEGGLHAE